MNQFFEYLGTAVYSPGPPPMHVVLGTLALPFLALPDAAGQGYVEHLDKAFGSGEVLIFARARYAVQIAADRRPGVNKRLVDFVYQPVRDVDDVVTGIFVEGYDVTERLRAEAELRSSEARMKLAQQAAGIGVWDWDVVTGAVRRVPRVELLPV